MKDIQQKNLFGVTPSTFYRTFSLLIISLFVSSSSLSAQWISVDQQKNDVTLPADGSVTQVYFIIKGGDGGTASFSGTGKSADAAGGAGARVAAVFNVGSTSDAIPPGSILRFVRGEKGGSEDSAGPASGGGGGGSAVLFRPANSYDWTVLAVAGGGGGGNTSAFAGVLTGRFTGKGGNNTTDGTDGKEYVSGKYNTVEGGTNGNGASGISNGGTGGAGANGNGSYSKGKGYPSGSAGEICSDCSNGGFGYGGGGAAHRTYATGGGGGGGYSGGGGSSGYGGGGGGSMVNSINAGSIIIKGDDGGGNDEDGYVQYAFNDRPDLISPVSGRRIQFAVNPGKCIDDYASHTDNGTNIQTYNCHGNANQSWYFSPWDRSIRSKLNTDKCLDLSGGNTSNGTNIQLWDCVSGNANQFWVYNGIHKTIHSGKNSDKCFDAANGSAYPNSNVNIQLWDCNYSNSNQKWGIVGATIVSNTGNVKHLLPVSHSGYAVHSHTGAESGSNIQLWTKDETNTAEQWIFDGLAIKMRDHQNLCIDLSQSNTSNGNNIQLYNCNGTNAQKWIYDGMTQSFRSVVNPDKCMQIEKNTDGVYGKRSNVQIWDCNGSEAQRFLIDDMPCVNDTTHPVAKCKNITLSVLAAPVASQIDNGSTDNCGVVSKTIANVSGNTWRLTVEDAAGNSSSCTATVTYQ